MTNKKTCQRCSGRGWVITGFGAYAGAEECPACIGEEGNTMTNESSALTMEEISDVIRNLNDTLMRPAGAPGWGRFEFARAIETAVRAKLAVPEPAGGEREAVLRGAGMAALLAEILGGNALRDDGWEELRERCQRAVDHHEQARAALADTPAEPVAGVDDLAQFIRIIDGNNSMGAGQLAERILGYLNAKLAAEPAKLSAAPVEPVAWEYRWTNPDNRKVYEEETAWKPLVPRVDQSMSQRVEEIRGYEHNGKFCYEARALYAQPAAVEPAGVGVAAVLHDMRAEFLSWVRERGCDTDGAWSAWQGCWNLFAAQKLPGIQDLAHVIHELRSVGSIHDEEGEMTDQLADLLAAISKTSPVAAVEAARAEADECAESGAPCHFGPYGWRGVEQCKYCGQGRSSPTAAIAAPDERDSFPALHALTEAVLTRADPDYMQRCLAEAVRVMNLHGWTPPVPFPAAIAALPGETGKGE